MKAILSTMGEEIEKSIYERSVINAALHNTKLELRYLKYCKENIKEGVVISAAKKALNSTYQIELIEKEQLFTKYNELYGEEYNELKLQIEKELKP